MKRNYIIIIFLFVSCNIFADNVQDILAELPLTSIPFECTKTTLRFKPAYAFPDDKIGDLPTPVYEDLGLTQKSPYRTDVVLFRRFKCINSIFDLIVLDLDVSEFGKKILAIYHENELIDYIETEVSWYWDGFLYVKQWRIDTNQEIIITWLKIDSPTPIPFNSNFDRVQAQRTDTYYSIDSKGKFQETKQVKYKPQVYTKAYLADKTKNLWEGKETPLE